MRTFTPATSSMLATAPAGVDASTRSAATGQDLLPSLLPALGVLAVLAVIGVLTISWARRRLRNPADDSDVPFTLEDLRRFRREGRLTEEEFTRARQSMLDAARRASTRSSTGGATTQRPRDSRR